MRKNDGWVRWAVVFAISMWLALLLSWELDLTGWRRDLVRLCPWLAAWFAYRYRRHCDAGHGIGRADRR